MHEGPPRAVIGGTHARVYTRGGVGDAEAFSLATSGLGRVRTRTRAMAADSAICLRTGEGNDRRFASLEANDGNAAAHILENPDGRRNDKEC